MYCATPKTSQVERVDESATASAVSAAADENGDDGHSCDTARRG